jgi:hypothetical protein
VGGFKLLHGETVGWGSAWEIYHKIHRQEENDMKSKKVWLIGIKVAFLITFFSIGVAHSQDLSGWVGQWFKLTSTYKGYDTSNDATHIPQTLTGKNTGYLKITAWNTTNQSDKFLSCTEYDQDEGGNTNQSGITLHYLGGTDLDFLVLCHIASEQNVGFTARITGKQSTGTLKSATFKTLGGYSYSRSSDPILNPRSGEAEGLTIAGSLISESKLPSWVPK